MTIKAEIVCDSISLEGHRLTTFKLRYPRFIHDEVLTHRKFSRNTSSLRAIPVKKVIEDVERDPAMPTHWGRNQKGMQAKEELTPDEIGLARMGWDQALHNAITTARGMARVGLHKQVINRILMPFTHVNVVVTSTEYLNFFGLRLDDDADPTVRSLAEVMWRKYKTNTPHQLRPGSWHLPFIDRELGAEDPVLLVRLDLAIKVSVARCARTSYESHETGKRSTVEEDLALYDKLVGAQPLHASPAEHQATPDSVRGNFEGDIPPDAKPANHPLAYLNWAHPGEHGNFTGWRQYRKMLAGEAIAPLPKGYRYETV